MRRKRVQILFVFSAIILCGSRFSEPVLGQEGGRKAARSADANKSPSRSGGSTPLVAVPVRSDGSKDFPKVNGEDVIEGVHHIAKFGLYVYKWGGDGEGINVWKVDPSGPAARAGIKKDDGLVRVNGRAMSWMAKGPKGDYAGASLRDLIEALRLSGNKPASLEVFKGFDKEPVTIMVTPLP